MWKFVCFDGKWGQIVRNGLRESKFCSIRSRSGQIRVQGNLCSNESDFFLFQLHFVAHLLHRWSKGKTWSYSHLHGIVGSAEICAVFNAFTLVFVQLQIGAHKFLIIFAVFLIVQVRQGILQMGNVKELIYSGYGPNGGWAKRWKTPKIPIQKLTYDQAQAVAFVSANVRAAFLAALAFAGGHLEFRRNQAHGHRGDRSQYKQRHFHFNAASRRQLNARSCGRWPFNARAPMPNWLQCCAQAAVAAGWLGNTPSTQATRRFPRHFYIQYLRCGRHECRVHQCVHFDCDTQMKCNVCVLWRWAMTYRTDNATQIICVRMAVCFWLHILISKLAYAAAMTDWASLARAHTKGEGKSVVQMPEDVVTFALQKSATDLRRKWRWLMRHLCWG